jgi:signal peptidase II
MTTQSARSFHFLIAALVVVLDQAAKWTVAKNISLHDNIQIIPGFFRLTHVENRGAAFGIFADSPSEWKIAALVTFSIVALAIVAVAKQSLDEQHGYWVGADSWRGGGQSLGPPA